MYGLIHLELRYVVCVAPIPLILALSAVRPLAFLEDRR